MQGLNPKDVFAGRYLLRKRLVQGRFSESWLVHNEMVGNEQVLRVYAPLDEQGCRAFRREFARAYHLTHPRLLRVTYFDVHEGRPYLVLPHFRRGSTRRMAGKLSEGEIARIMRDIGGALAFIHQPAYDVVHRDVRPESILLSDSGNYLLNIFGVGAGLQEEFYRHFSEEDIIVSREAGKAYQPPEWFQEEKAGIGPAADIWALGATLYELASGRPPFGQSGGEGQLSGQEPPALPSPFSLPLSNILSHCMAESPKARPSADSLRKMAEDYLESGQWPAHYLGDEAHRWQPARAAIVWKAAYNRIAAVILVIALLAAGLLWAWPKLNIGDYFAGNQNQERDPAVVQPMARKTPETNAEPPETGQAEKGETIPASDMPAKPTESGSRSPAPPPEPAVRETPPPPVQTQEERPARKEAENAVPSRSPSPEKAPKKNLSGEQATQPGTDATSGERLLQPRFNEVMGKWGYVDKKGEWIIWPQFEEAGPFIEGKAKVARKGSGEKLKAYYLEPDGTLTPVEEAEVVDNEND